MQTKKAYVDYEARAVQNYMVGNIAPNQIANQLRSIAEEMIRAGERTFALVTMTQMINEEMRKRQPMQVTFLQPSLALGRQASIRWKAY